MKMKLFLLELGAILIAYTVMMIPAADAIQINLILPGTSQTIRIDPRERIGKEIQILPGLKIRYKLESRTITDLITSVEVYKCKDLTPDDCIKSIPPETFSSGVDTTFDWPQIASPLVGYPQTANLLTVVKFQNSFGSNTLVYWDSISRTGSNNFETRSSFLDELDYYVGFPEQLDRITEFIRNRLMLPMTWADKVVFKTARDLYKLDSQDENTFNTEVIPGNQISSIPTTFSYIYPSTHQGIQNGMVLYKNPSFSTGDSDCRGDLGENELNSCFDCGCSIFGSRYYCDTIKGCQVLNPSLSADPSSITIPNCYQDNAFNASLNIRNPPSDLQITSASYTLGNSVFTTTCLGLQCPIVVPRHPDCGEGQITLATNTITVFYSYKDGPNTRSSSLTSPLTAVTLTSYQCGNNNCESSLGETPSNCCYDCPCSAGYCDYRPGNARNNATCRLPFRAGQLRQVSIDTTTFTAQPSPGNTANIRFEISDRPFSIRLTGQSCNSSCSSQAECQASCSIYSQMQTFLESQLTHYEQNYNPETSYSLTPEASFSFQVSNGSQTIPANIPKPMPTISLVSHACGDRRCDTDESPSNCCFDCPCASGNYCDTRLTAPSKGDSCKPFEGITMGRLDFPKSRFIGSGQQTANLTVEITNPPSSLKLRPACFLAGGNVGCSSSCELAAYNAVQAIFTCQLVIDQIVPESSSYYNPSKNEILLGNNSLNLSLSFANGSQTLSRVFSRALPDITIIPTYACGQFGCERQFGESAANCCIDCGCESAGEGYFCSTLARAQGDCLAAGEILMLLNNTTPEPYQCTIGVLNGDCKFTEALTINAQFIKAPQNFQISDAHFRYGGKDYPTDCSVAGNSISCGAMLPDIPNKSITLTSVTAVRDGKSIISQERKDIQLFVTMSYEEMGKPFSAEFAASRTFTLEIIKSEQVQSCEDSIQEVEKAQKKMQSQEIIMYVFFAISTAITLAAAACCFNIYCLIGSAGKLACLIMSLGLVVVGCVGLIIFNSYSKIKEKFESLKAKQEALCSAGTIGQQRAANTDMGNVGDGLIKVVLGIVCAIGVLLTVYYGAGVISALGNSATPAAGTGATSTLPSTFPQGVPVTGIT